MKDLNEYFIYIYVVDPVLFSLVGAFLEADNHLMTQLILYYSILYY